MNNKVVVLASGGLDSAVLLAMCKELNYDVYVLYIKYGNCNEVSEISKLYTLLERLEIPQDIHTQIASARFPWSSSKIVGGCKDTEYVSLRNFVFASMGLSYAQEVGASKVLLGFIDEGVNYDDTSPDFVTDFNTMSYHITGINVEAPLMYMTKKQVYKKLKSYGYTLDDIHSCNVGNTSCGECAVCKTLAEFEREDKASL